MKQIFLIAVSLSMDALAVAIAVCGAVINVSMKQKLRLAALFGIFQFGMTFFGWLGGKAVSGVLSSYSQWIAFLMLCVIGLKMIYESVHPDAEERPITDKYLNSARYLLGLSVATSLDALAVGLSFGVLKVNIMLPALIIGVVAFAITLAGTWLGQQIGLLAGRRMVTIGGIVLIIIGCDIINLF